MGGNSPCASCKLLRRRCAKDCIFAPYFGSDDPHKFAIVHKVFGASNVSKMLQEVPIDQRGDAVSSLVYEANARVRDPVYGCVGAISYLQNQVSQLQMQLAVAQAEILCIDQMQQQQQQLQLQQYPNASSSSSLLPTITTNHPHHHHHHHHHHQQVVLAAADSSLSDIDDKSSSSLHQHQRNLMINSSNIPHHQYLNFSSSATNVNHVSQDPLKRESLWT